MSKIGKARHERLTDTTGTKILRIRDAILARMGVVVVKVVAGVEIEILSYVATEKLRNGREFS